jgi:hypothetical protein
LGGKVLKGSGSCATADESEDLVFWVGREILDVAEL